MGQYHHAGSGWVVDSELVPVDAKHSGREILECERNPPAITRGGTDFMSLQESDCRCLIVAMLVRLHQYRLTTFPAGPEGKTITRKLVEDASAETIRRQQTKRRHRSGLWNDCAAKGSGWFARVRRTNVLLLQPALPKQVQSRSTKLLESGATKRWAASQHSS